jgi:hypothetical protein
VSITCTYDDFIRVNGNNPDLSQIICTKIIAVKETGHDNVPKLSFYALISVDNQPLAPANDSLPIDSSICRISIDVDGSYKNFAFRLIPTTSTNDYEAQLLRYCSPLDHVHWSPLKTLESPVIYVLEFIPQQLLAGAMTPPLIHFSFPILDTLDDRMELEELAATRHHCTLIPCSDFIICPTTLFEPTNTSPQHMHCTNNQCVRFFEENF